MSYIHGTTHPMTRRQSYLDKISAARKEYFRAHPDESQRRLVSLGVCALGGVLTVMIWRTGWPAFMIFVVTVVIARVLGPKSAPK